MENFWKVIFQGWKIRTLYYGFQSTIFFLYLNHLVEYLDIDTDQLEKEEAQ